MSAFNDERSRAKYYTLKAKTSDTDATPYIGLNQKVSDKWAITDKFNSFKAHLIDIKHESYKFENEDKHKAVFTFLEEDGSQSILSSNFNNLLYSALNSLASQEEIGVISLSVWLGKAKIVDDKEGKQYASVAVKNGISNAKWKYQFSEQPKADIIQVGKKQVSDDTKVVEFWSSVIDNEIKPKLKNEVVATTASVSEEHISNSSDDLPF